ncbi:Adenomatous polyposis coli protein [Nymphon striatum]|nr:Adenomatous polyposis coli protein [Nymphon striatum]
MRGNRLHTDVEHAQIVALLKTGLSQHQISEQLGVITTLENFEEQQFHQNRKDANLVTDDYEKEQNLNYGHRIRQFKETDLASRSNSGSSSGSDHNEATQHSEADLTNFTNSNAAKHFSDKMSRNKSKMTTSGTQTAGTYLNDLKPFNQYHGTWPVDSMLWHSVPSAVSTFHSFSDFSNQEVGSLSSLLSNSGSRRCCSQQLDKKMEMVISLLSMLNTDDKEDMSKKLLALSSSQDHCIVMRQSGCLPLLIQLLHGSENDSSAEGARGSVRARQRASTALRNIVHAHSDDKQGRREASVLGYLENIREYCDELRKVLSEGGELERKKALLSINDLSPTTLVLMRLSYDEEYRLTMCQLGGLHAIAEFIQVDYEVHGNEIDPEHITLRRYAGMALTNLSFGDGANKALLCSMKGFMKALVAQLHSPNENLRQVTASLFRNLSWRADLASKKALREVGVITTLMKAAMEAKKESTLKSILSALWNLTSHCSVNKEAVCAMDGAISFLVGTLTYNSSSDRFEIIENGGGVLRNISSQIAVHEEYRLILRKHNCLQILLQHLISSSLAIVSNACGTLWNLSAKNATDQKALWEMDAVTMLKSLIHSKHKMISMGSTAALKNLMSAKPPGLTYLDSSNKSNMPSLHVRKQKALEAEINQNLSETCDNIEGLKNSPTAKSDDEQKFSFNSENSYTPTRLLAREMVHGKMYHSMGPTSNLPTTNSSFSVPRSCSIESVRSDISHDRNRSLELLDRSSKLLSNEGRRRYSPSPSGHHLRSQRNLIDSSSKYPKEFSSRSLERPTSKHKMRKERLKTPSHSDDFEGEEEPRNYSINEDSGSDQDNRRADYNNHAGAKCHSNWYQNQNQNPNMPKIDNYLSPSNAENYPNSNSFESTCSDDADQLTNFSLRYNEHNENEKENAAQNYDSVLDENDTIRTYFSEGTPTVFSAAVSQTDLREIETTDNVERDNSRLNSVQPSYGEASSSDANKKCRISKKNIKSINPNNENKKVIYCDPETSFSNVDNMNAMSGADSPRPLKVIENFSCDSNLAGFSNGQESRKRSTLPSGVNSAVDTPMMFSRCSSLGSLVSCEQLSICEERSSVCSDYSRFNSGNISPSDIPESFSRMSPIPQSEYANCQYSSKNEDNSIDDKQYYFEDKTKIYNHEGTPAYMSSAPSLSDIFSATDGEGHTNQIEEKETDEKFASPDDNSPNNDQSQVSPNKCHGNMCRSREISIPSDEDKDIAEEDIEDIEDNSVPTLLNNSRNCDHNNAKLSSKVNKLNSPLHMNMSSNPVPPNSSPKVFNNTRKRQYFYPYNQNSVENISPQMNFSRDLHTFKESNTNKHFVNGSDTNISAVGELSENYQNFNNHNEYVSRGSENEIGDEKRVYAVEDTPICFSRRSSFSSLENLPSNEVEETYEHNELGGSNEEKKVYAVEDTPISFSRRSSVGEPFAVDDHSPERLDEIGDNEEDIPLVPNSVNIEPTPYEQKVLFECISSALPKSKPKKKRSRKSRLPRAHHSSSMKDHSPVKDTANPNELADLSELQSDFKEMELDNQTSAETCYITESISEMSSQSMTESKMLKVEAEQFAKNLCVDEDDDVSMSCASELDQVNPPSLMGELMSMSLCSSISSEISNSLSVQSSFGAFDRKRNRRHLPVPLHRMLGANKDVMRTSGGSDLLENVRPPSNLGSVDNLSMRSSCTSEIINDINPPSIMEDVSVSSTIINVNKINENKPMRNTDIAPKNSFNSSMKASMIDSCDSELLDNLKPPSCFQELSEVDGISLAQSLSNSSASDTEIEEELPCDDEEELPHDDEESTVYSKTTDTSHETDSLGRCNTALGLDDRCNTALSGDFTNDEDGDKVKCQKSGVNESPAHRIISKDTSKKCFDAVNECSSQDDIELFEESDEEMQITSEQIGFLEADANLIVDSLKKITDQLPLSAVDAELDSNLNNEMLIDEENISLVSVGSDSENSKDAPVICQTTEEMPKRPRIVKPINRETVRSKKEVEEQNQPKSIRGRRKPLAGSSRFSSGKNSFTNVVYPLRYSSKPIVKMNKSSVVKSSVSSQNILKNNSESFACSFHNNQNKKVPSSFTGKTSIKSNQASEKSKMKRNSADSNRPSPPVKQGTFTKDDLPVKDLPKNFPKNVQSKPTKISPKVPANKVIGKSSNSANARYRASANNKSSIPNNATSRSVSARQSLNNASYTKNVKNSLKQSPSSQSLKNNQSNHKMRTRTPSLTSLSGRSNADSLKNSSSNVSLQSSLSQDRISPEGVQPPKKVVQSKIAGLWKKNDTCTTAKDKVSKKSSPSPAIKEKTYIFWSDNLKHLFSGRTMSDVRPLFQVLITIIIFFLFEIAQLSYSVSSPLILCNLLRFLVLHIYDGHN